MKISKQAHREAKQLFKYCCQNGTLDEGIASKAVKAIVDIKPRGFVKILQAFGRLVELEIARKTALVETAVEISSQQQTAITRKLKGIYGEDLNAEYRSQPELLGGIKVRVGCDIYDGSVQAQIQQIASSLRSL